jgi:hypothetical protein
MSGTYAAITEVSVQRSRNELESTLARYGATGFAYIMQSQVSIVAFEMRERRVMFRLTMPDPQSREIRFTATGKSRTPAQQKSAYEQLERERWRALNLVVKAKLESVESGIETFEEAFLPHIVLPNGQTYGQFAVPQIQYAYEQQEMPSMLPGVPTARRCRTEMKVRSFVRVKFKKLVVMKYHSGRIRRCEAVGVVITNKGIVLECCCGNSRKVQLVEKNTDNPNRRKTA